MRILLLATNTEEEPYPVFPLGMAVVAQALIKAGHHVKQIDFLSRAYDDAALNAVIRSFVPDAVGISLRNIDNVDSLTPDGHWSLNRVRHIVTVIRAACPAPILMGGAGFSLMPDAILDYCGADFGFIGEGERTVCSALAALERGERPPRLTHGGARLCGPDIGAACPDPAMIAYYAETSGVIGIQTKRGCPNACIYCSYPTLEGGKVRARTPEAVVDDMERMHRDCPNAEIFFTDSVFNDAAGHWLHIVEEIVRRGLVIPWTGFFQPIHLTSQDVRLCKRSGLKAIEFGTDAASDATLAGLNKGFTFDAAEQATRLCIEHRIPSAHFVIFGGPGETEQTIDEGLSNLDRLHHSVVFAFLGIRVYPDTPLQRYAIREGSLSPDVSCLEPVYYFSPHIRPEWAEQRIKAHFSGNRERIFPPSDGQKKIAIMRRLGYRGILWDTLIHFPESAARRVTS